MRKIKKKFYKSKKKITIEINKSPGSPENRLK